MKFNPVNFVSRLFSSVFNQNSKSAGDVIQYDERLNIYDLLWSYYINNVYSRELFGGHFDYVNRLLGEAATNELYGMINPIEQVIELYAQNTFAGQFGKEFYIEDAVNDGQALKPVNPALLSPIASILKWSNFNQQKDRYARLTALFGNCGIRIVVKVGSNYPNDDISQRRVFMQFEHPALIEDYLDDGRSNITQVMTQHRVVEGDLSFNNRDQLSEHVYRLLLTKDRFETERDGAPFNLTGISNQLQTEREQDAVGTFTSYINAYGFVPYCISSFRKHDGKWGAWAFLGSESSIDRTNSLNAHIEKQIFRHTNVTWLVTTTGDPPKEFNFSGNRVLLIKRKTELEGVSGDTRVEPLIANLDLSGAMNKLSFNYEQLSDKLPELKAIAGQFLSGQSGETISQLRKPAEDKLLSFRTNLESTLIRAIQMALSVGIVLGLWDVGTGTGTREQADRAYNTGLLDFEFNKRPALTITRLEELTIQQLEIEVEQARQDTGTSGSQQELARQIASAQEPESNAEQENSEDEIK